MITLTEGFLNHTIQNNHAYTAKGRAKIIDSLRFNKKNLNAPEALYDMTLAKLGG